MDFKTILNCPQCGGGFYRPVGEINRAAKRLLPLYCGRECSGLARRKHRSADEKRAMKADYDRKRRLELGEALLAKKREAHHAELAANPGKVRAREKLNRINRRAEHAEYCRSPEYREWKRAYDRQYLARKNYGPFAEAALVLRDLEQTVLERASRYEIDLAAGQLGKVQRRKREYAKAIGC
jgi:hypothetical protein